VFNVGPLELLVVLIIALIVLGPKRLPEVARSVGRGMREFRNALDREHDDDDDEHHEPEPGRTAEPAAAKPLPEATPRPDAAAPAVAKPAAEPAPATPRRAGGYQKDADSSEPSSSSSGRV
jgi:sec-independent protein translocase protein TatA